MSVESRLAAKERSRSARRKAQIKKWTAILFVPVLALLIVGGIFLSKAIKKAANTVDFGKYLTKEGTIAGVATKDLIKTFPDLNNITDLEISVTATEEEIKSRKISTIKSMMAGTDDALDEDVADDDVLALLKDEWVKKYAEKTLTDQEKEVSVAGFEAYVKELADETAFNNAKNKVTEYMTSHVELNKLPKDFTKFLSKKGMKYLEKREYDSVAALYAAYFGVSSFEDYITQTYGSEDEFKKAMAKNAESAVTYYVTWLEAFDRLGLSASIEDYKKELFEKSTDTAEENEAAWKQNVETYSEEFLLLQYKCSLAVDALTKKLGE